MEKKDVESKHVEISEPRSFVTEMFWRLQTNFPVRSNIVVLVLCVLCAVGIILLSGYVIIMSYDKKPPLSALYGKFEIKNISGIYIYTHFFDEFTKFNAMIMAFGKSGGFRVTFLIALVFFTIIAGAVFVILRLLIPFLIAMVIFPVFGLVILWFGGSSTKYTIASGEEIFSFLLQKYDPSYDCFYNNDQLNYCLTKPNLQRNNYSEQVGDRFHDWECCGYNGWEELTKPPNHIARPLFCCPYIDQFIPDFCTERFVFPPCRVYFKREVLKSQFNFVFKIATIVLAVLIILLFIIVLAHVILICRFKPIAVMVKEQKEPVVPDKKENSPKDEKQKTDTKTKKKQSLDSSDSKSGRKTSLKSTDSKQKNRTSLKSKSSMDTRSDSKPASKSRTPPKKKRR